MRDPHHEDAEYRVRYFVDNTVVTDTDAIPRLANKLLRPDRAGGVGKCGDCR